MKRWRLLATVPLAAGLLLAGPAHRTSGAIGEPPGIGANVFSVLTYGYYCTDHTKTCTEDSGKLRYIGIEAYGHDDQRGGYVSPDGYFVDCGRFFVTNGQSHFYHEWIWDKSWLNAAMVQPQPRMQGSIGMNVGGDDVNPSTNAYGSLVGSSLVDPVSGDKVSVINGSQVADNSTHTITGGTTWHVTLNGPVHDGLPTTHDTNVVPGGPQTMDCQVVGAVLFSHVSEHGQPYAPQYMAESTFEPYDTEINYPQ